MLRELPNPRQHTGETRRRIFLGPCGEVCVWVQDQDVVLGFQITYVNRQGRWVLTWRDGRGYRHEAVDDEVGPGMYKPTELLTGGGPIDRAAIGSLLQDAEASLPAPLYKACVVRLEECPLP